MEFENIYNTYENTVRVYGNFDLPVPTYVIDKKIDFRVLCSLLLRSNKNLEDKYRYIYYYSLDRKEICKELGICQMTLNNKIKYLEQTGIITYKNTSKGVLIKINYSKDDKYYVKINHEILHYLIHNLTNYHIKAYLLLTIQCKVLENTRPISISYLCNKIGYSIKNQRSLDKMSKWTNELVEHGLIKKNKFRIYNNRNGKKLIERVDTYYKIVSYEDWLENK